MMGIALVYLGQRKTNFIFSISTKMVHVRKQMKKILLLQTIFAMEDENVYLAYALVWLDLRNRATTTIINLRLQ